MKIIGLTSQNSGVGYHRLLLPISYMPKKFAYFTDTLTQNVLEEGYDILLINRVVHNLTLEDVLDIRNKYNMKLVIDIDDFWFLDPYHFAYDDYPSQKVIDHIRAADLVTCTNERLWQEIKPINPKVEILPNALPYGEDQYVNIKTESDKIRFVHTGSITHDRDIELLRNPMKRVWGDKSVTDKAHFTICGYNDTDDFTKSIWHKMISDFTCGLKLPSSIVKNLPVTQYMNFYTNADCSLVPLLPTRFTSMKSNLKILEAAATKIPVICSNVPPYDDAPHAIKINKQPDWYASIKKVVSDSIYRKEMGEANAEWCMEHFNLFKWNETRLHLYQSLIN